MPTLSGLTEGEAARRLAATGANALGHRPPRSLAAIARGVLREPMFVLLLMAALLYLAVGDLG
ncbi:hypothetical protein J8J40_28690, partial [Mycobacterium tuberculosis]|nr:hypothetical protein [Mycobacterium tuberculosis]MBP0651036.1 hypothetical protein [Mycobacterium tuberculosis]